MDFKIFILSPWGSFFMSCMGILIGAFVTWILAWFYYKKAGNELKDEATKLRLASDLILYKLQYPDAKTELKRDDNGNVTGLIVKMSTKL